MIKVCHLSTVHQRRDVRIVFKECTSLAQAGYEVHLAIADGQGDELFRGIRIHGCVRYTNRLRRILLGPPRLFFHAIKIKAELYHFHDMELLPAALALRLLGFKVIYDVHDDLPKQIMGKHYIPRGMRRFLSASAGWLEGLLSRRMSAIVTAVEGIAKRFGRYHKKVRCVHNYPLLEELELLTGGKRDPRAICYIGGITAIRGIKQLLDAIQTLDLRLILAGRFDPPTLEEECRKHPAWSKVDYRGFLDRRQVADVLSTASLGLVNYLPSENHLDALPTKLCEYMSAGLPVVASDFPELKAIVERHRCGLCVNPRRVDQLSEAIRALLEDPVNSRLMGARGREAVLLELNWESQARLLIDLYHEVLGS